jgi:histidinol-phosphate aminotransferase
MKRRPPFTALVAALPGTVPFVAPDVLERRRGRRLRLRLGANESAFGISPLAAAAMQRALRTLPHYADPECYALRERLSERDGVTPRHLVVGAGIDDLLGLIVRTFVAPGDVVVASLGSYPTFAYHVVNHGGRLETVPYRDDRNDLDALAAAAARSRARVCYLANPDNPSGSFHDEPALEAFLRQLPDECLLILDEAYVDFAPSLPRLTDDPRLIRARTFSKLHGLAGARIGYLIAEPGIISAFDKVRLHFGVNAVAQAGALASLDDPQFAEHVAARVAEGRREYAALGAQLSLATLPSATNFVCIDFGCAERARALLSLLLEHDTFVRMPSAPPLDRCVRITVGTEGERAEFAALMRQLHADGALDRLLPR